jgi:DNA mismatch endonuclease (patch repair protein)
LKDVARVPDAARSRLMARVRRTGTEPELSLRKALHGVGLRYRLAGGKQLPGTPDIAFRRSRVAVFVDGCFWHGCRRHGSIPKTNVEFWDAKIRRNKQRDREADRALRQLGWDVVRVCEHDVRTKREVVVRRISLLVAARIRR